MMHGEKLDNKFGECHFMVKKGIILGHEVSRQGIEVERQM